jgi:hypothetical protein
LCLLYLYWSLPSNTCCNNPTYTRAPFLCEAVPGARRWRACILGSKRPWINQISHGPTREQPIGWSCCCVEQKRFDKQVLLFSI